MDGRSPLPALSVAAVALLATAARADMKTALDHVCTTNVPGQHIVQGAEDHRVHVASLRYNGNEVFVSYIAKAQLRDAPGPRIVVPKVLGYVERTQVPVQGSDGIRPDTPITREQVSVTPVPPADQPSLTALVQATPVPAGYSGAMAPVQFCK